MGLISERLRTRGELKASSPTELDSTFKLGEDVWLWHNENVKVEGIIAGVNFSSQMVTYDVGIPVKGTDLYIVTYGIRGGITKPDETYPGVKGGLIDKVDVPVVSMNNEHLH